MSERIITRVERVHIEPKPVEPKQSGLSQPPGFSQDSPDSRQPSLQPKSLSENEMVCWLRLVRDRRWSTLQKRQLLGALGCPVTIYNTPAARLGDLITGRKPKANKPPPDLEANIRRDLAWVCEPGHSIITFDDPCYPRLLKEITDPPMALFAIGDLALLSEPKVAIVGSRRPTPVGAKVAQSMASDLGGMGVVVTSGMALGIDGLAHQAVLDNGNPTIAVMGCGLDTIYPSRNRHLFEAISHNGLLLSEYPLGVPASKYTFPQRNRVVSGLCYGVVIVEAAERSGTLITARLALEQDRELMVVPGSSVSSQYAGSHRLLQQGASLVLNGLDVVQNLAQDLRSELNTERKNSETDLVDLPKTNDELCDTRLLEFISVESTPVDHIISESGLTAAEVSSMLLILEMHGLVVASEDGGYLNVS